MAGQNLELALRIKADLADAVAEVHALTDATTASATAAQSATTTETAHAAAIDKTSAAAATAADTAQELANAAASVEAASQAASTAESGHAAALGRTSAAAAQTSQQATQASGATRELTAATEGASSAAQKASAAVKQLTDAISAEGNEAARVETRLGAAFSALNLRSIDEIRYEIRSLQQAYETLRTSGTASAQDISRAEDALKARVAALNAEIRGQAPALASVAAAAKQVNQYGLTAGQQMQAMRMLPAQITDIVSGLTTGQSPLTVMIQQGGQLRDSFGGVVPAVRALVGALNPMVLAIGAAVGSVGAIGLGMYQAAERAAELARAFELTGNRAGMTSNQVTDLARNVAQASGQSVRASEDIAQALINTGAYGAQSVSKLTLIIADFAKKTGTDTDKATEALDKVFRDPAKGAAELNKQLNFLSYEQLKNIDTLQKQNRLSEAQAVLADALSGKLQTMQVHQAGVSGWWDKIKTSASDAWNAMFSPRTDTDKLTALQANLKNWQQQLKDSEPGTSFANVAQTNVARIQAQIAALSGQKKAQDDAAKAEGDAAQKRQQRITAMGEIDKLEDSTKTKAQQRAEVVKRLDDELKAGIITQAEYNRGLAAANKAYEDKSGVAAAQKIENAYDQQKLELTKDIESGKRKLEAAQKGITTEEGRSRDNLDAWLNINRTALKLQPQQVENLRKMADEADRLAKASADATYVTSLKKKASSVGQTEQAALQTDINSHNLSPEDQTAAEAAAADYLQRKDAETLKQINQQYLSASGDVVAASAAATELKYGELMARLAARGDEAGLSLVKKLINVDAAKSQMDALQTETDRIFARQTLGEQQLQTQVMSGALTQSDAQQKVLDLHKATAAEIEALLPKMMALAQTSSDPRAVSNVAALQKQVAELKNEAGQLETAFKGAFTSSMSSALSGLADGTKSLGEAVQGFLNGLATGMANFAAQQLSEAAFTSVKQLFTTAKTANTASTAVDTASTAANAAAETASATATATAITGAFATGAGVTGAGITTAGATAATTMGAAITAAGTSAAAAMATAIATASASSSGASAAAGAAAVAAATGGFITGPGTATSDSIPAWLSAGEFVSRAAVVSQPGARQFLHMFNRHGMRALGMIPRFANGGLVGGPSFSQPALPGYKLAEAPAAAGGNVSLGMFNYFDMDQMSQALASNRQFEKVVVNIAASNGGTIRRSWQD